MDFGPPIGRVETVHSLHSEMLTFPTSFGAARGSFRLSLPAELLEAVRELASGPVSRIDEAAAEARPASGSTVSSHLVEARSGNHRVRVSAVTGPHAAWGLGGGVVSTATPAAAAVRLLVDGRLGATGALPPELCIGPEDLFPELEARGCRFRLEAWTDTPEPGHAPAASDGEVP